MVSANRRAPPGSTAARGPEEIPRRLLRHLGAVGHAGRANQLAGRGREPRAVGERSCCHRSRAANPAARTARGRARRRLGARPSSARSGLRGGSGGRPLLPRSSSAGVAWRTRVTDSAASLSISSPRAESPVTSTIALRAWWPARTGASSERRPDSRLTTPPGTSAIPITSPRSNPGSGRSSDRHGDGGVTGRQRRRQLRDQPEQRRRVRRHDPDHAGWLGQGEGQVRRGDRVDPAEHRLELVRPARVVHQHIDRGLDVLALGADVRGARLERLREAVKDLATVIGGARRPAGQQPCGRRPRHRERPCASRAGC